eukprot:TRINITY_DN6501_c0_g1_i3.p1 TRINITY_DN6501_c0_g1~~TRINITY_DN6501_c0_g1_i3.p1  ORF type:complete len:442 (+),score=59.18 TRINITY_DN6501_c0_g1_i3:78-1403(+)
MGAQNSISKGSDDSFSSATIPLIEAFPSLPDSSERGDRNSLVIKDILVKIPLETEFIGRYVYLEFRSDDFIHQTNACRCDSMVGWFENFTLKITGHSSLEIFLCSNDRSNKEVLGKLCIPTQYLLSVQCPPTFWCPFAYTKDCAPGTLVLMRLSFRYQKSSIPEEYSIDDFEPVKILGRGSYGKVYLVRCKHDEQHYAMKRMNKDFIVKNKRVMHILNERRILLCARHPFICNFVAAFQTKTQLYIVQETLSGGELYFQLKRFQRFEENRARFYAGEVALGLIHLHGFGIIYRDLKPENVMIDSQGHIRLIDFGLSKVLEKGSRSTNTFCGTPEYMAPEVIRGNSYTQAVDWWGLGTLLFEMLVGVPPFYDEDTNEMYDRILNDPIDFPYSVSKVARSLIEAVCTCIQVNTKKIQKIKRIYIFFLDKLFFFLNSLLLFSYR